MNLDNKCTCLHILIFELWTFSETHTGRLILLIVPKFLTCSAVLESGKSITRYWQLHSTVLISDLIWKLIFFKKLGKLWKITIMSKSRWVARKLLESDFEDVLSDDTTFRNCTFDLVKWRVPWCDGRFGFQTSSTGQNLRTVKKRQTRCKSARGYNLSIKKLKIMRILLLFGITSKCGALLRSINQI